MIARDSDLVRPSTVQEPIITESGQYLVTRYVGRGGSPQVHVGDLLEPETVIGSAAIEAGRPATIDLAQELGISPGALTRYLTKPVGSRYQAGEQLARTRRGLRTVTSEAPISGVLSSIDEPAGTVTLTPEAETVDIRALLHGEVIAIEGQGVTIRAAGIRVRGSAGLGADVFGPIRIAADRPDRELTPEGVTNDMRGAIVLAGMTVGASTMRRLAEVGAHGVIVGSVAEIEVRRMAQGGSEPAARGFWGTIASAHALLPPLDQIPFSVFVTEGFGRRPMAEPIFEFLRDREGESASLVMPGPDASQSAYPALYLTTRTSTAASETPTVSPADGFVARLVDPQHLGMVVTCHGEMFSQQRRDGVTVLAIEVQFSNGTRRVVPVNNLEVLTLA